jgi:hypothetical protein
MGGACSTYGRDENCIINFVEKPEDLGVDRKIILKWIFGK